VDGVLDTFVLNRVVHLDSLGARNRLARHRAVVLTLCLIALFGYAPVGRAQDNYEIQVYGADTVAPKVTMVELHSNFTVNGFKAVPGSQYQADGTYPTNHAQHETIEITQGITKWSEVGFYIFTSARDGQGWQWVGDHIRPRVRAPDSWHLPVGLSLSNEIGYQRARFSPDTWTWEIRPIIDKQVGRWYLSVNPTLDRVWHGPGVNQGVTFSPNAKAGYDFTRKVNAGIEYYGAYGDLSGFDTLHYQQQQFFLATDLNVSPKWEFNFGIGVGATSSTDHFIVKAIVGRRFSWGHTGETPDTSKGDVKQ
jgi:hypothetical protein